MRYEVKTISLANLVPPILPCRRSDTWVWGRRGLPPQCACLPRWPACRAPAVLRGAGPWYQCCRRRQPMSGPMGALVFWSVTLAAHPQAGFPARAPPRPRALLQPCRCFQLPAAQVQVRAGARALARAACAGAQARAQAASVAGRSPQAGPWWARAGGLRQRRPCCSFCCPWPPPSQPGAGRSRQGDRNQPAAVSRERQPVVDRRGGREG